MLVSAQAPGAGSTFLLGPEKSRAELTAGKRTSFLIEVKQIGHEKGNILLKLCHLRHNTFITYTGKIINQSKQNFSLSI